MGVRQLGRVGRAVGNRVDLQAIPEMLGAGRHGSIVDVVDVDVETGRTPNETNMNRSCVEVVQVVPKVERVVISKTHITNLKQQGERDDEYAFSRSNWDSQSLKSTLPTSHRPVMCI